MKLLQLVLCIASQNQQAREYQWICTFFSIWQQRQWIRLHDRQAWKWAECTFCCTEIATAAHICLSVFWPDLSARIDRLASSHSNASAAWENLHCWHGFKSSCLVSHASLLRAGTLPHIALLSMAMSSGDFCQYGVQMGRAFLMSRQSLCIKVLAFRDANKSGLL